MYNMAQPLTSNTVHQFNWLPSPDFLKQVLKLAMCWITEGKEICPVFLEAKNLPSNVFLPSQGGQK